MNFRVFDDLVGSAPGASQESRFRKGKNLVKYYSAKSIEKFWKVNIKFLKFLKHFKNLC